MSCCCLLIKKEKGPSLCSPTTRDLTPFRTRARRGRLRGLPRSRIPTSPELSRLPCGIYDAGVRVFHGDWSAGPSQQETENPWRFHQPDRRQLVRTRAAAPSAIECSFPWDALPGVPSLFVFGMNDLGRVFDFARPLTAFIFRRALPFHCGAVWAVHVRYRLRSAVPPTDTLNTES